MLECFTGQRASDLPIFFDKPRYKVIDGYMSFVTQKKKVRGKTEMTKEVMGIIDKYKDGFRYVDINIHKLSMYISNTIKVIAKKANLDRPIEYTDNKRQQKCEPLWLLPLVVLDNRRGEGSGRGSCRN